MNHWGELGNFARGSGIGEGRTVGTNQVHIQVVGADFAFAVLQLFKSPVVEVQRGCSCNQLKSASAKAETAVLPQTKKRFRQPGVDVPLSWRTAQPQAAHCLALKLEVVLLAAVLKNEIPD